MTQTTAVDLARLRTWTANGKALAIRQEARLSRAEVASEIQVHESSIANWETGRRTPRGEAAARYFTFLSALAAELLS